MCELGGPGDPQHGPVLDTDVFVGCERCPLGCAGSTDPTVSAVSVLGWLVEWGLTRMLLDGVVT